MYMGRPVDLMCRRWTSITLLVLVWLAVSGAVPSGRSAAHAAPTREVVHTRIEAWHRISVLAPDEEPTCDLPAGCPAPQPALPPADAYPDDTLHVGRELGRDVAQTFFTFDLRSLPSDATVVGGLVTLPVAGAESGTSNPQAAEMVACLLDEPPDPVQGGESSDRPDFDCEAASSRTIYDMDEDVFIVDLAPIGALWADGAPNHGVAIVPDPDPVGSHATWRVVFHGKDRDADDAVPITADVAYQQPAPNPDERSEVAEPPPPSRTESDPDRSESVETGLRGQELAFDVSRSGSPAATRPGRADEPQPLTAPPAGGGDATQEDSGPRREVSQPLAVRPLGDSYPHTWLLVSLAVVIAVPLGRSLSAPMSTSGNQRSLVRGLLVRARNPRPGGS